MGSIQEYFVKYNFLGIQIIKKYLKHITHAKKILSIQLIWSKQLQEVKEHFEM